MVARYSLTVHFPVAAPGTPDWPPLSTSELLDKQPERRRLTVVFVCGPLREFFGTTAYSLGVAVALPMLKGVAVKAYKQTHPGDDFALLHHREQTLWRRFQALFFAPLWGIDRLSAFDTQEHPLQTLL